MGALLARSLALSLCLSRDRRTFHSTTTRKIRYRNRRAKQSADWVAAGSIVFEEN